MEIAETSSQWDNNKRVEEARRVRVEWLQRLRSECTNENEFQAVKSQPVWTQLTSTSCASSHAPSGPSPARLLRIREENGPHYHYLTTLMTDILFALMVSVVEMRYLGFVLSI